MNNDRQQLLKKGKIILDEGNRLRLVCALKDVNNVVLSIDEDPTIIKTLEMIARLHPRDQVIFVNGGDRDSSKTVPEKAICKLYGIEMEFDAGGTRKSDSSTRINQALGHE